MYEVAGEVDTYNATIDIESFLLYKELQRKNKEEQQALRYRWRGE